MRNGIRLLGAALIAGAMAQPAAADDFEDAMAAALEAYRGEDYDAARRQLEQADGLLDEAKAAQLSRYLPAPFSGWRRQVADPEQLSVGALGGAVAQAAYTDGEQTVSIKLIAGSALASSMAAMRSSFSYLAVSGQVQSVAGRNVIVDDDGSLQGLIDSRIVVEIEGEADVETKKAYFAAIDAPALSGY